MNDSAKLQNKSGDGSATSFQKVDNLAPVVQTMDSAIRRINHYPLDNSIGFASLYPLGILIYPVDSAIHLLNNWGQLVDSETGRNAHPPPPPPPVFTWLDRAFLPVSEPVYRLKRW